MTKTVLKCQNRKGMVCIHFKGKNIYYKNEIDLAKKLGVNRLSARKFIREDGRRIIVDEDLGTRLINIKTDNLSGLLLRKFNRKRINNKILLGDEIDIGNSIIVKQLNPNDSAKFLLDVYVYISFPSPYPVDIDDLLDNNGKIDINLVRSEPTIVKRHIHTIYDGEISDLKDFIRSQAQRYVNPLIRSSHASFITLTYRLGDFHKNKKLIFKNGYVRSNINDCFKLTEWANIEYEKDYDGDDTCAVRLISKRYPDLYWKIKKHETSHGITIDCFMKFCKKYNIGYNIYNELGKELYTHKSTMGLINAIVYNNHIYPTNGGKPKRYSIKQNELNIHIIKDSRKKMIEFMHDKKKLPSRIIIDSIKQENNHLHTSNGRIGRGNVKIRSFIVGKNKYICNEEYEKCKKILEEIGCEEYIYDSIRINDIPFLLEKILKCEDCTSFIPEKSNFKTSPLLYKTEDKIRYDKVETIDKNKCYTYSLYSLDFLYVFDYRKDEINTSPKKINKEYMYLARPSKWSILMPETKIYGGSFLLECQDIGLEFTLLEELQSRIVPNYYKQIIDITLKHIDGDTFKNMWNIYIGKLEREHSQSYNYKYTGIYNKDSSDHHSGFFSKLGDFNLIFKETNQYSHVMDKLPISTQIKDNARLLVYKQIKKLNIKDKDIIQINTDSISYYGKLPSGLDSKRFSGWKESEFKELGDVNNFCDINKDLSVVNIKNKNKGTRILHMKFAGAGKTTYIRKELIKKLIKDKVSYIVITPTYKTLLEYKLSNIPCEIFQKFSFSNSIPEQEYIIVDEIGFVDKGCHNVLYNMNMAGKSFECFGDFNQLQPIGELKKYNTDHYLNYMFNEIDTEFINYRNIFTSEYYLSLIMSDYVKFLSEEISKWSSKKYYNAEYIVCYRHKTRNMYNNLMLKKLGFSKWNEVGVKVISTTNKLLSMNICNKHEFEIIKINKKDKKNIIYVLKDLLGNIFEIQQKDFTEKKFQPAYAINIHQCQGMTLDSYYWCPEDDAFLNGNVAYTIISRIKKSE